jgi:hypothetical protein
MVAALPPKLAELEESLQSKWKSLFLCPPPVVLPAEAKMLKCLLALKFLSVLKELPALKYPPDLEPDSPVLIAEMVLSYVLDRAVVPVPLASMSTLQATSALLVHQHRPVAARFLWRSKLVEQTMPYLADSTVRYVVIPGPLQLVAY